MIRIILPIFILLLWIGGVIAGYLMQLDPDSIDLAAILAPPNSAALFGRDDIGRSILDRIIAGAETSLIVSVSVTAVSVVVGTCIGSVIGYIGGIADMILVRVIDIFLAFPGILLAIALAAVMGPGIENIVIALSLVGWVGFARLSRAQVLSIKEREHVQAAVALGTRPHNILIWHILPLIAAPLIVEATFGIASIIIAEAGLSYLGLGVQPPQASWGSMIRDGSQYLLVAPHMVIFPGLVLMSVVLAVNLLGDRFRDMLDVKDSH